jgi:hypothetical protein
MCRSIKTLRPPYVEAATPDDAHAAALQFVRKVAGMRKPSAANQAAFDDAVRDIAEVTQRLLSELSVRTTPARAHSA